MDREGSVLGDVQDGVAPVHGIVEQADLVLAVTADAHAAGAHAHNSAPRPAAALALRLGFRLLKGLPGAAAAAIVAARQQQGPFVSLADFARRTGLGRALIVRLSEADVFASLQRDRRRALWEALSQTRTAEHLPLFAALPPDDEPPAALPTLSPQEEVLADYRTAGLSLKAAVGSLNPADLAEIDQHLKPAVQ